MLNKLMQEDGVREEIVNVFNLYKCWGDQLLEQLKEFGRFPDRNAVLGRRSNQMELLFLSEDR
jgi:uncharacterized protein (DUF924 family)